VKIQKFRHLEGYDSRKRPAGARTQSAEYQAESWCVVVSEPETKEYKVVLKSAGLWTTLTPFPMDIGYVFTYLFISNKYKYGRFTHYTSFKSITLKLKHPFMLVVAGPSSCGKSTFVIRLLEYREQLCYILFQNIVWCHSENNAPHHLKRVSFVKGWTLPILQK